MDSSKFIEEKIQKAIADGEFENLAGAANRLIWTLISTRRRNIASDIRF